MAAQYGIAERNIYDYQTMHRIADNPEIDVVYVVTPNAVHLQNALVAAKAGKHVLCEKPMEISVERCRQMIDAVKSAGRAARHRLPLPVRTASLGMHANRP